MVAWKDGRNRGRRPGPPDTLSGTMAGAQTQTTPQRLAAIREQMSLLTDYL